MKIDVLTLFPEQFEVLNSGIVGRALREGVFSVSVHNIRDFSRDKHKKCDDAPFGGGAGMVMTAEPIHEAISAYDPEHKAKRIYMSPRGSVLKQDRVKELALKAQDLLILCGGYEGVDQRVIDLDIDEELSIGDYILTGGELAALVLINSVSRYVPGVLGSYESLDEESFAGNLLEYPHYTRPRVFEGISVPDVLLNGNHKEILEYRLEEQIKITRRRRKDLYRKFLNDGKKNYSK